MGIVDRKDWSGVKNHPFKVDNTLKVKGVPTLIYFKEGKELMRATQEYDFNDRNLLAKLS